MKRAARDTGGPLHGVASNRAARKSRNLVQNGHCVISCDKGDLHLIIEGEAREVRDEATLRKASDAFHEIYDWPTEVAGDQLDAPYGAPTSGGPPTTCSRSHTCERSGCPPTASRSRQLAGSSLADLEQPRQVLRPRRHQLVQPARGGAGAA